MNLERYRHQFEPARQGRIYLNHCGVSPLSDHCAHTMKEAIERNQSLAADDWAWVMQRLDDARESTARLLNVSSEEIALTRNTTEGMTWVANGLDWQPGDRVVSVNGEYPTNIYPFMRLEQQGVELHLIEPIGNRVTLEQIEQALTPNTRLLAISLVQFVTGFRFDLEAVGALCREKGVLLAVDLIQGLGVLPVDLSQAHVDFACGGAQKWLIGPQGAGFFYCRREQLERIEPTQVGSDSMANKIPYTQYEYLFRPNAQRFEYSTLSTLPLIGMGAAIDLLLEAGIEPISQRIKRLTDHLTDGLTRLGWPCISPRDENEWSGIIAFSASAERIEKAIAALNQAGIFAMEREGNLRLAPHFYQTLDEMQKVVTVLRKIEK